MAYVLSLSASSPVPEPHRNYSFRSSHGVGRSYSSAGSGGSSGTMQHHRLRSLSSGSSLSSLSSLVAPAFRRHDEHGNTSRSSSSHNLTLRRQTTSSDRRSVSGSGFSRRTSFASALSSRRRSDLFSSIETEDTRLLDVAENDYEAVNEHDGGDELSFVQEERPASVIHNIDSAPATIDQIVQSPAATLASSFPQSPEKSGPRRWLSTLRQRKQRQPTLTSPTAFRFALDDFDSRPPSPVKAPHTNHKKTNSWSSSLRLVAAVRSATATLASMSIATGSRKNNMWGRRHRRSSLMSGSETRPSVDSQRSVIDEAAKQRSRKRRDKMEELIRSEESYVADVKALSNVSRDSYYVHGIC